MKYYGDSITTWTTSRKCNEMEQICQFQDMHNIQKKWDNSVIHRKKRWVIKRQILIKHRIGHREVDPVQEIPLLFKTTMDLLTMGWRLIALEKWIPSVSILWHANTMTSCHMKSIWLTVIQLYSDTLWNLAWYWIPNSLWQEYEMLTVLCNAQFHTGNALCTSQISEAGQKA
jgi:hypothetical protein